MNKKIPKVRQAEIIAEACKKHGLEDHIKWLDGRKDARTWAEKIAAGHMIGVQPYPVKNSYAYCDTLDMTFYLVENCYVSGECVYIPQMTYAGYVTVDSADLTQGRLQNAFNTARAVLETMQELVNEEVGIQ